MSYYSIFDSIAEKGHRWGGLVTYLRYAGSLNEVLNDLVEVIKREDYSFDDDIILALHPPRILRAIIDYKIEHPEADGVEDLLIEAVNVALSIYSHHRRTDPTILENLRKQASVYEGLLNGELRENKDSVSWDATYPERSEKTVLRQFTSLEDRTDILFISLAHGSLPSGMDVFLRYQDLSKSSNSVFYPVRLSRYDKNDKEPQLTAKERSYLKDAAKGRYVVIYDEDSNYGKTIKMAEAYFSGLFPGSPITATTNYHLLSDLKELVQKPLNLIKQMVGKK